MSQHLSRSRKFSNRRVIPGLRVTLVELESRLSPAQYTWVGGASDNK
jgi:hypothetical protein